jgi:ankyrin repeat protein
MSGGRNTVVAAVILALSLVSSAAVRVNAEEASGATIADAVEQGHASRVRSLLEAGGDVNGAQVDGMTALHWAAYFDDASTAALLVEAGAKVNAENHYGVTALSLAATNRNASLVALLLDSGADANASLRGGETVLLTAARTGSLAVVEALLASGADPNATERREQTALMWAAADGHAAVVRALIDAGAEIDATLRSGFTPLFFAVREGHIDVVQALVTSGADLNATLERVKDGPDGAVNNASYRPVDDGMSSLLLAVRNGHFELAIELVKDGADPNDRRTGFTPLHTMTWVRRPDASDRGDPAPVGSGRLTSLQFVRAMVALGADVNARLGEGVPRPPHTASSFARKGSTPFVLAADRADAALMRQLLELGADPFLPNEEGSTALMAAAGLGTTAPLEEAGTELEAFEAVQLLLALGADIDAVDHNGDTPMHGAAYANFPSVVHALAESGADPTVWQRKNQRGLSPLFIAEGYRGGGFKPSRPTMDAVTTLMRLEGFSTEGPRPKIRDIYETPAPTTQQP